MRKLSSLGILSLFLLVAPAHAQLTDPANDFLGTYTGPQSGDVDVLAANAILFNNQITLSATMNGNIGLTPGALYVWGFDRGLGTARFAAIGATGVLFDSVVLIRPDGSVTINRIVGGGSTNFAAGSATVSGSSFSFTFNTSELPTQGFATKDYTWNLWPRVGTGNNNQISDFAPDNANFAVVGAPEPASVAFALLLLPVVARFRRK